jgi:hypothetical protein
MDTVLEEFVEGLSDPLQQSPSVCLKLPTMPNSDSQGPLSPDFMVLSMLHVMDTDNELLCQYYDRPALLQVQQPFAEILSSPSFSANNGNTINMGNTTGTMNLLQRGSGAQSTHSSTFSKGTDAVGAFHNGMASRFLPTEKDMQVKEFFFVNRTSADLS